LPSAAAGPAWQRRGPCLPFPGEALPSCPRRREGKMYQTLIYEFFARKTRIIVLTILTYAALC